VLLVLARALVVLLALQVSGLGPVLWGDCCTADGDDCSGQSDGKPCGDCPPGCPGCHCDGAPFGVPPPVATGDLGVALDVQSLVWTTLEGLGPREASLSSIFRPPKRA
jgi:hypothetical protein